MQIDLSSFLHEPCLVRSGSFWRNGSFVKKNRYFSHKGTNYASKDYISTNGKTHVKLAEKQGDFAKIDA